MRFRTRAERDRWVATTSGMSIDQSGYRDTCSSRHPYVRLGQRYPEMWGLQGEPDTLYAFD